MVTGPEVALASTAGKILVDALLKAIPKVDEVLKKRKGLEGLVRTLEDHLSLIQAFILDHRKIIRSPRATSQTSNCWIARLRCYAYDMEDCIEGYHAKKITGVKLHDKITALLKQLETFNILNEHLSTMQVGEQKPAEDEGVGEQKPAEDEGALTNFLPDLLNKREDLRKLLGLLQEPRTLSEDRNLKVTLISIVGVGGIGKTNLCEQVYKELLKHNNNLGQNKFSQPAFVSAAGKDGIKVLEDIIKSFPEQEPNMERAIPIPCPRQDIAQDGNGVNRNASIQQYMIDKLARHIRAIRYLIVVDDVESEAMAKFIISAFPENNMGGRIIMAATVVGLSTAEAEHIDGQGNESEINEQQQHQFNIVNSSPKSVLMLMMKHDKVPLALVSISEVVISRHFSGDGVEEAWRQIREAEADQWLQRKDLVLRHIYESLDSTRDGNCMNRFMPDPQACLLYFSIFPHGYYVKRGSLIRRWLAEGRELGGTSFKDADKNLNLINQKFIRPLHLSLNQDRHFKPCQPPEVVQDFIDKMSQQESFIMLSCSSDQSNYTRRLSLRPTDVPSTDRRRPRNDNGDLPPRLRTLAVSHSTSARGIVKCEQLRVLDLGAYPGLEPSELKDICEKLKLLKYLCLKPDKITEVPDSVSNLQWLETLDMGTDKVVLVPIHVVKLPKLKHLLGKFEFKDSLGAFINKHLKVSEDIKNSKLERLAGFVTRKGQGFPTLMCHMKKLWKVKIWFCRDAHAKSLTTYLPEAITKFLQADNIDRSLSLDFKDCANPEELLDSLAGASGRLYSLKLSCKRLIKIHSFVTKLTGVTKLCLSWKTIKLDEIFLDELSKLNQLKYLKLDAETIEGAYDSNPQAANIQNKVVIETRHIENLKHLCLLFKQPLPDIEIKHRALEKLVSLHLISEGKHYCPSANMICKANVMAGAPLMNLSEVTLSATVPEHSRNRWHEAARNHPKRPTILFIEHPRRAG